MAISNPLNGERKIGTVGKPLPGVEVSTHTMEKTNLQIFISSCPNELDCCIYRESLQKLNKGIRSYPK